MDKSALNDRIIEKRLQELQDLGAQYIIKNNAGVILQHGELKLEQPEEKKRRDRSKIVPRGSYKEIYVTVLACMEPGDRYTFFVPPEYDIDSFRAAASSHCSKAWGNGSFTAVATYKTRTVEFYRLREGQSKEEARHEMIIKPAELPPAAVRWLKEGKDNTTVKSVKEMMSTVDDE